RRHRRRAAGVVRVENARAGRLARYRGYGDWPPAIGQRVARLQSLAVAPPRPRIPQDGVPNLHLLIWRRFATLPARKESIMPGPRLSPRSHRSPSPAWREAMIETIDEHRLSRRRFLGRAAAIGVGGLAGGLASIDAHAEQAAADHKSKAVVGPREPLKIAKLETFIHRNSWVFVKITTDAGIVGWGEMLKDKCKACAAEAQEMASYLVGKDPRPITQHWQAIYRHGFYRGGPILTAVLSGIDMALWDIKGKALGLPVHELLGGPTRRKIRVYGSRE